MPRLSKKRRNEALVTLKEARRLIARPKGWVKGMFHAWVPDKDYQCYCAIGAINNAAYRGGTVDPSGVAADAKSLLAEAIPFGRYPGQMPQEVIFEWNDDSKTRKKDVLAAFDSAIATLESV